MRLSPRCFAVLLTFGLGPLAWAADKSTEVLPVRATVVSSCVVRAAPSEADKNEPLVLNCTRGAVSQVKVGMGDDPGSRLAMINF